MPEKLYYPRRQDRDRVAARLQALLDSQCWLPVRVSVERGVYPARCYTLVEVEGVESSLIFLDRAHKGEGWREKEAHELRRQVVSWLTLVDWGWR